MNNQEQTRFSPKEMSKQQSSISNATMQSSKTRFKPLFSEDMAYKIITDVSTILAKKQINNKHFNRFLNTIIDINNVNSKTDHSNWQQYLQTRFNLSFSSFNDAFIGIRTIASKYKIQPFYTTGYNVTYKEWSNVLRMCFQHNINSHTVKENQQECIILSSLGDRIYSAIMDNTIDPSLWATQPSKKQSIFPIELSTIIDNTPKYTPRVTQEQFDKIPKETIDNILTEVNKECYSTEIEFKNKIKQILSNFYIINKRVFSHDSLIEGDIFSSNGIKLKNFTFIMFPNKTDWSGELVVLSSSNATSFNYLINKEHKICI